MNLKEKQMLDILKRGKERWGFDSVKAEFEAEGTRMEELLRLTEIARRAGVKVALKIGGAEAIRDLIEARQIGVDYIIAPMVETPYSLSKFIEAKNKVYRPDEREDVRFLSNLETKIGYDYLQGMVQNAIVKDGSDGFVFGRLDFVLSMGRNGRNAVNDGDVTDMLINVAEACKRNNLDLVMGGGIGMEAIDSIRQVQKTYLTRYETRKIVFDAEAITQKDASNGIAKAVDFELLWLKNKKDYYGDIYHEDDSRIEMMEARRKAINGD